MPRVLRPSKEVSYQEVTEFQDGSSPEEPGKSKLRPASTKARHNSRPNPYTARSASPPEYRQDESHLPTRHAPNAEKWSGAHGVGLFPGGETHVTRSRESPMGTTAVEGTPEKDAHSNNSATHHGTGLGQVELENGQVLHLRRALCRLVRLQPVEYNLFFYDDGHLDLHKLAPVLLAKYTEALQRSSATHSPPIPSEGQIIEWLDFNRNNVPWCDVRWLDHPSKPLQARRSTTSPDAATQQSNAVWSALREARSHDLLKLNEIPDATPVMYKGNGNENENEAVDRYKIWFSHRNGVRPRAPPKIGVYEIVQKPLQQRPTVPGPIAWRIVYTCKTIDQQQARLVLADMRVARSQANNGRVTASRARP